MPDNNWGIFRIVPAENGGKPRKLPMDLATGRYPVSKDEAFVHSLDTAKNYLNGGSTILGYLPRPGSAYIGGDLDECLDGDEIETWADEILDGYPDAVTPSGHGLRIMMPRADGDHLHNSAERNGVGIFADGSKAFTVPADLLPLLASLKRQQEVIDRLINRMGSNGPETAEGGAGDAPAWFRDLTPDEQLACAEEALRALPDGWKGSDDTYHDWLHIGMGLYHTIGEAAFPLWAEHSTRWANHDPSEDLYTKWRTFGRTASAKRRTVGSLFSQASKHGWKDTVWRDLGNTRIWSNLHGDVFASIAAPEPEPEPEPDPYAGEPAPQGFWDRVDAAPEPVFTMEDYLPQRVCTGLFAKDGLGKSMWALTLACHLAAGRSFMGRKLIQGNVMFLSVEDPWEAIAYRMRAIREVFCWDKGELDDIEYLLGRHLKAYTDMADTRLVTFDRDGDMSDTPLLKKLDENYAKANEPIPLTVFDPISDVYADEENVRHKVAPFLRRLNVFSDTHATAGLLLGHPAKSADSRYSGSTAWSSKLRSRLFMEENETDRTRCQMLQEKVSWGRRVDPADLKQTQGGVWVPLSFEESKAEAMIASHEIRALILATLPTIAQAGEVALATTNTPRNIGKLVVQFAMNVEVTWQVIHEEATKMISEGQLTRQPMDGENGRPVVRYANRTFKEGLWPTEC